MKRLIWSLLILLILLILTSCTPDMPLPIDSTPSSRLTLQSSSLAPSSSSNIQSVGQPSSVVSSPASSKPKSSSKPTVNSTHSLSSLSFQSSSSLQSSSSQSTESSKLSVQSSVPTSKICYLTFDDGPSSNTPKILKILKDKNVKATWFVKSSSVPQYMTDIHNAGHTVAIHTYSHDYAQIYKSCDAYFKDLYKIKAQIKQYTGVDSVLCRFPGGSSNTVSKNYCRGVVTAIAKRMKAEGYIYFDWNVDSGDASGNNIAASKLLSNVKKNVGSQRYVNLLMHDTGAKGTTVKALPQIIDYLRSKGYIFEAITADSYAHHHAIAN